MHVAYYIWCQWDSMSLISCMSLIRYSRVASAMLFKAAAPSTRQTSDLVAFGGRTSAKSFRSPDSKVDAFSFFTRHAQVYA